MHQFSFEAIGTRWVIDIFQRTSALQKKSLEKKITERIDIFDKIYSRFRADSLIARIAQRADTFIFPEDAKELFQIYQQLYHLTDGKFTPLIGNVLEDAGYDAQYSLHSKSLTHPNKWEDVLTYHHPKLTTKKPVTLDFGAGGKGYLVDIIGQILLNNSITNFCIDAGGDILFRNSSDQKISIGLENPLDTSQVIGVIEISNQSICGSAGNRRAWNQVHHIIDPQTLKPIQNIIATWVIADSALLADTLATCLFLTNSQELVKKFNFEYLILFNDYSINKSENFNAEIYYQ